MDARSGPRGQRHLSTVYSLLELVDLLLELVRVGAHHLVELLALFHEVEGGHGRDAGRLRDLLVLVDVDLDEDDVGVRVGVRVRGGARVRGRVTG